MKKVVGKERSGFLGLGKTVLTVHWHCDRCGVLLGNPDDASCLGKTLHSQGKMFCRPCADKTDLDIAHHWEQRHLGLGQQDHFFVDSLDGKQKQVEQCLDCAGMRITQRTAGVEKFLYFQVGRSIPLNKGYRHESISDREGFTEYGDRPSQVSCDPHDWKAIATSKKIDDESRQKYSRLMGQRDSTAKSLEGRFGIDPSAYEMFSFGVTHYWCWKCGDYYYLSPSKEYLLPPRGVPLDLCADGVICPREGLHGVTSVPGRFFVKDYAKRGSPEVKSIRGQAEDGVAKAQYMLGDRYRRGAGVPEDFVLAHMWFNLASAQGEQEARKALQDLATGMTKEQIAEAQKMARHWKKGNA